MFNLIQRLSEDFQILDCCWEWITKYFHLMNEISYHWEIYMNLNSGLSTRAWKRFFFLKLTHELAKDPDFLFGLIVDLDKNGGHTNAEY